MPNDTSPSINRRPLVQARASGPLYVDRLLEESLATHGKHVTEVVMVEGKVLPKGKLSKRVVDDIDLL